MTCANRMTKFVEMQPRLQSKQIPKTKTELSVYVGKLHCPVLGSLLSTKSFTDTSYLTGQFYAINIIHVTLESSRPQSMNSCDGSCTRKISVQLLIEALIEKKRDLEKLQI